ncbi:MAG TPA: polyribonucleotide nucleotidyltransferase [Chthonomonadales bacterium]|nr:polyribonucleotide nucleotidyltransferase [Chthonomonadales bacterium]
MAQTVEGVLGGRKLSLETGKVAHQANGSCWLRCGDTVVLATATMAVHVREGIDFFPLTCDYEERKYSVGKIPGGFIKRGGRPSEKAILTSRLIDRPLRPLFPSGMRNEVQVIAIPLSVDHDNLPDVLAVVAASTALTISNIPWGGPVGCVRVGRVEGEWVVNPTLAQLDASDVDLIVAGTEDRVNMLECCASEVSEADIAAAIEVGHEAVRELCRLQTELAALVGTTKVDVAIKAVDPDLLALVREQKGPALRAAVQNPDKAARESGLTDLKDEIVTEMSAQFAGREAELGEAVEKVVKEQIRSLIVDERIRPDGRRPDEVRPIKGDVGLLPRVHGSGLFTRGQTQVLTSLTLGSGDDAQTVDGIEGDSQKRYMHFYNFPPFSVGETRPLRGPGRREIGHGALAERALLPVLPSKDAFPYTLQLTSEVLGSNGSTSMGATCGSTLALMDGGVPITLPVSGIAMGLMTRDDTYVVLSDIQGMEDFSGDMDFKVAGTEAGITAIQLDTKIRGLTMDIVRATLEQAKSGRAFILSRMLEAIGQPRESLSDYAPRIFTVQINPEKIGEIIGPGGKVIKKIEAETGASVSIEQDGTIYIAAVDAKGGEAAANMIRAIVGEVAVGEKFTGRVTRLMGMGAFVEFIPGKEGLVHLANLSEEPVRRPEEAVKVGDEIQVRVIEVDSQGRINLSAVGLDEPFDPSTVRTREPRDRGPRGAGPERRREPDRGFRGAPGRSEPPAAADEASDVPKARFRPKR